MSSRSHTARKTPAVPAEGSAVLPPRKPQRPRIVALRRRVRGLPGALTAYNAVVRARHELRAVQYAARGKAVALLSNSQADTRHQYTFTKVLDIGDRVDVKDYLRHSGVEYREHGSATVLRTSDMGPVSRALASSLIPPD